MKKTILGVISLLTISLASVASGGPREKMEDAIEKPRDAPSTIGGALVGAKIGADKTLKESGGATAVGAIPGAAIGATVGNNKMVRKQARRNN